MALRLLILGDIRSFHLQRYVDEIRRQGVDADVASCEFETTSVIPLGKSWKDSRQRYHGGRRDLRQLITNGSYDLVNAHFVSGYGFMASLTLPRSMPLVMHAWGSDILIVPKKSLLHRWKTQYALHRSVLTLADSGYLADEIVRLSKKSSVTVIPWGVEEAQVRTLTSKTLDRPLRLISPRRLEPIYGIRELIIDLRSLLNTGSITLTVPAFGSLRSDIDALIARERMSGVSFYDALPRSEFFDFLRTFDVYCSNTSSDSSPASLLEAMALGLIPIMRDHPGVRTWLEPNNGMLIGRTHQSFAEAVSTLLAPSADVTAMREENQQRILKQAIFERNIADTIALFEKVIRQR